MRCCDDYARALRDEACQENVDCVSHALIEVPAHHDGDDVSLSEGDGESSGVFGGPWASRGG
jgi:hypothetical protein